MSIISVLIRLVEETTFSRRLYQCIIRKQTAQYCVSYLNKVLYNYTCEKNWVPWFYNGREHIGIIEICSIWEIGVNYCNCLILLYELLSAQIVQGVLLLISWDE